MGLGPPQFFLRDFQTQHEVSPTSCNGLVFQRHQQVQTVPYLDEAGCDLPDVLDEPVRHSRQGVQSDGQVQPLALRSLLIITLSYTQDKLERIT